MGPQRAEPAYRQTLRAAGVSEAALVAVDNDYRALGRFHYEFSRIIFYMRLYVRQHGGLLDHSNASAVAQQASVLDTLTNKTAGVAGARFFDYCLSAYFHSENDLVIAAALRSEFARFNQIRNHLSHGEFTIGFGDSDGIRPPRTIRISTDSTVSDPINYEGTYDLDKLGDEVAYHKRLVGHYSMVCLMGTRIADDMMTPSNQLCIRDGRVERVMEVLPERDILTLA